MREILQSSSPNKDHELKCSAADTCRIPQPMQCCTERPLLLKEGKSQRLLTQTSVLAGKGVWGETGGGPAQWGDKLWKGGWSENITKLFHVVQSLRSFFFLFFIAKVFISSASWPQTVWSQRDTWTFGQLRCWKRKPAFVAFNLGALMVEFLSIFNNLAKSSDSQWK